MSSEEAKNTNPVCNLHTPHDQTPGLKHWRLVKDNKCVLVSAVTAAEAVEILLRFACSSLRVVLLKPIENGVKAHVQNGCTFDCYDTANDYQALPK